MINLTLDAKVFGGRGCASVPPIIQPRWGRVNMSANVASQRTFPKQECCGRHDVQLLSSRSRRSLRMACLAVILYAVLGSGYSQTISEPTEIKLEYWRSFHGVIKQEVRIVQGRMSISTTVMRGMSAEDQKENTVSSSQFIEPKDLKPIVDIFNDARNRDYFMATAFDDRLDGSSVAITVTQNQFSMTFTSMDAFVDASSPSSVMGKAAKLLFELGGVKIPKEELY